MLSIGPSAYIGLRKHSLTIPYSTRLLSIFALLRAGAPFLAKTMRFLNDLDQRNRQIPGF